MNSAPVGWSEPAGSSDNALHQIAPYIGKLKPIIARELISAFTVEGELVLDCFAGSGTVPLEATLMGRRAIAVDSNRYAVTLTRAKLEAPTNLEHAMLSAELAIERSKDRGPFPVDSIPQWVRKFFHPQTLQDALHLADDCIEQDDPFLLACLLGILHHQRPGFLSFPSSHLVPYLRDRKYPRDQYPEMYEARELAPRLLAKVQRALRSGDGNGRRASGIAVHADIAELQLSEDVDAIITSPPYMNALDYVRDNRLRMWFVDRSTVDYSPEPTDKRGQFAALSSAFVERALPRLRRGGRCILVVGETVRRKMKAAHPAEIILNSVLASDPSLVLEKVIEDEIPDIRRSRRYPGAIKRELVLVIRRR